MAQQEQSKTTPASTQVAGTDELKLKAKEKPPLPGTPRPLPSDDRPSSRPQTE